MTLYLEVWLMLCSREEFSFRHVYVSMLVGTKQLYTQVSQEIPIRNNVLRQYCKSKEKMSNFQKFVRVFLV